MASPDATVILPYRDAAGTIAEALQSVLAERSLAIEVVAVDNGSSDRGARVVADIAARDGRVIQVSAAGVTLAGALAAAAARARAPYLVRMDADDVSLPGRIAAQLDLLGSDRRLGAVGGLVETGPGAETLARYVAWQNALVTPEDHAREIFVESPLCHPSVTIRRAALEAVGGYRDAPWPEDWDLWLRLDAAGWRIAKAPCPVLEWRHAPGRYTFSDRRAAPPRLVEARAHYLAPRLRGRQFAIWGAGKTGKHLARALEAHGVRPTFFVDIDPEKIDGVARDRPIVDPSKLLPGDPFLVVAVGAPGARATVRGRLIAAGFVELEHFVCAA